MSNEKNVFRSCTITARQHKTSERPKSVPSSKGAEQVECDTDERAAEVLARLSEATARSVVPYEVALRVGILPLHGRFDGEQRGTMYCVSTAEFASKQKSAIERILNCDVLIETIPEATLRYAIELAYGVDPGYASAQALAGGGDDLEQLSGVETLLHMIVCYALLFRASDIHIRGSAATTEVMIRVDGTLRRLGLEQMSASTSQALERILRVHCGADITKSHLPAEGSCSRIVRGKEIRLRVSFLPTTAGHSTVIRILGAHADSVLDLETLGLAPFQIEIVKQALDRERGAIFLCGPTGSGKSTLLATFLKLLTPTQMKIISIEDPVEYRFPEIEQVDLPDFPGMTIDDFLPRFLRQDPDVIVVGETRSQATARTALEAACTGHLVLSTLHAGSVHEALARLERLLGTEQELLDAIHCIVLQRLIPRNCQNCIAQESIPEDIARLLGLADTDSYSGTGCLLCGFTGISGRIGVFEVYRIVDRAPASEPDAAFHRSVRFHIAQRAISAKNARGVLLDQFAHQATPPKTTQTKSRPRILELTERVE